MKTYYKPPSVDRVLSGPSFVPEEPVLKECPSCESEDVFINNIDHYVVCDNDLCLIHGPDNDPTGTKWNSIPRKSEVRELLRWVRMFYAS